MASKTQQFMLDNGLKVILREAHSAPVISTWMWYRVGSRNETGNLTGLSHWVEHMLFKGSNAYPKGSIMRLVGRHGGYVNAMTSQDFTVYYSTLSSDRAHLALDFEADRMTGALFDPEEVASEQSVIIAEREGGENEPRYVLIEEMAAAAFRLHPYHHQTIGWKEDLQRITRDDLYNHYRNYYVPNNAVLVVVGDLDIPTYLDKIREKFEGLPSGSVVQPAIRSEPPQRGERRVTLRMPGAAPIVHVAYHAPAASQPDYVPLVVADAILSGGKAMFSFGNSQARSARLYRALVETELASSVGSDYHPSLDPHFFSVGATVREDSSADAVEEALLREMTRLQETLVSRSELEVAIRQTQAHFAYSSESVTSQALTLGYLEMVDHHERFETILDELAQVTPEDVQRVAQTYLVPEECTVGCFIPTETTQQPTSGDPLLSKGTIHRGLWAYDGSRGIGPQSVMRTTLDNGIVALIQERPSSAAVSIGGLLSAGSYLEDQDTLGITSFATAMLRRGTAQHTFQELNVALDNVGALVNLSAGRDQLSLGGRALGQDIDLLIELLAEILIEPSFPEQEFARLRGQILTRMSELAMDTGYRAHLAFVEALYSTAHPYGRPLMGTRETVSRLTRDDLLRFYQDHFHPQGMIISVVGAIDGLKAIEKLNATLGQWQPRVNPPHSEIPAVDLPHEPLEQRIDLPEKPQADLMYGVLSMPRHAADYYAGLVANIILGNLGMMGRLGDSLRDTQGLVYYIGSDLHSSRGPRPWTISAGVPPHVLEQALEAIETELCLMRDERVSDQELEDSQTLLTGSLPLHLETNEGIAGFLLSIENYDLGLDFLQHYPDLINAVTADAIQEVMQRYWPPGRCVISAAGTFG